MSLRSLIVSWKEELKPACSIIYLYMDINTYIHKYMSMTLIFKYKYFEILKTFKRFGKCINGKRIKIKVIIGRNTV